MASQHVAITRATLAVVVASRSGVMAAQGSGSPDQPPNGDEGSGAARVVPQRRADLSEAALPAEYRRLWLTVRESAARRAGQLAGTLGLEVVAAKVEGVRYKLKRLVARVAGRAGAGGVCPRRLAVGRGAAACRARRRATTRVIAQRTIASWLSGRRS